MRRSLSRKMLLLTLGSSLVLILAVLGSLYAYFTLFYTPVKIDRTVRAINRFAQTYESGVWSQEQLYVAAYRFMKDESVYLVIDDATAFDAEQASITLTPAATPVAEGDTGTVTRGEGTDAQGDIVSSVVILPAESVTSAGNDALPVPSESVTASAGEAPPVPPESATPAGNDALPVLADAVLVQELPAGGLVVSGGGQASSGGISLRLEDGSVYAIRPVDSADVYGMLTSTVIDGMDIVFSIGEVGASGMVVPGAGSWPNQDVEKRDGVAYTVSNMTFTNSKEVYFWRNAVLPDGSEKMLSVYLSLQPVEDVARVFLLFLPFVLLLAVLISLLGAYVHDRTVVRPILRISEAATRMAGMERDVVSPVDSGDELGILSSSINTLSGNLHRALDDLTDANRQLVEDVRQKTRQEQVRREFVANVSHELKTPLAVVKSYAEGLLDGVRAEKRDRYTAVILEEVERMDNLVREMLEISRLDAGAVVFSKQPVESTDLVEQALSAIAPIAEGRRMRFDVEGDWGPVRADAARIGRVLDNLIGNAVRHGREGTVVRIRGRSVPEGVEIAVENACDPLPEEQLAMIWDRFYKGDTSHSRSAEGAGLGLAIVRSILEGHGCPYGVENTTAGVRFFFVLEKA